MESFENLEEEYDFDVWIEKSQLKMKNNIFEILVAEIHGWYGEVVED